MQFIMVVGALKHRLIQYCMCTVLITQWPLDEAQHMLMLAWPGLPPPPLRNLVGTQEIGVPIFCMQFIFFAVYIDHPKLYHFTFCKVSVSSEN